MRIKIETAIAHSITIEVDAQEAGQLREAIHEVLVFKPHSPSIKKMLAGIEEALDNR